MATSAISGKPNKNHNQSGLGGLASSLLGGQSHGSSSHGGGGGRGGGLAGQLIGGMLGGGKPHNQQQPQSSSHSGSTAGYGQHSGGHQQGGLGSFFGGHHGSSVCPNLQSHVCDMLLTLVPRIRTMTLATQVEVTAQAEEVIPVRPLQQPTNHPTNNPPTSTARPWVNRTTQASTCPAPAVIPIITPPNMVNPIMARPNILTALLPNPTIPSTNNSHTLVRTAKLPSKATTLTILPSPLPRNLAPNMALQTPQPPATAIPTSLTNPNPKPLATAPIPAPNTLHLPKAHPRIKILHMVEVTVTLNNSKTTMALHHQ